MPMDNLEKEYGLALAHLEAGVAVEGIASIRFRDGEMVMISLEKLETLVTQVRESGRQRAILFLASKDQDVVPQ
jgi:hypothetical protein